MSITAMEFCVVCALSLMALIAFLLIAVVCKLCEIRDWLRLVQSDVNLMQNDVRVIKWPIVDIQNVICTDEDECCCDDTEDDEEDLSGYSADVVVLDELVGEEDELDVHLITAEEYYFGNGYSKNELSYYPNTDQVKYFFDDDTCLAMEDIPEYIGEGLLFFGMNVKEPNVVYVRNHVLNADFRIEKVAVNND